MATAAVLADSKVNLAELKLIEPKTGGVGLASGMLFLLVVASVWASFVVGFHLLELYVVGVH